MKQAVAGLIIVLVFLAGVWVVFQIFSGADRQRPIVSQAGTSEVPRRLPALEKAQLEVELSLVDAEFAAKDAAEARLQKNRHIKIDQ